MGPAKKSDPQPRNHRVAAKPHPPFPFLKSDFTPRGFGAKSDFNKGKKVILLRNPACPGLVSFVPSGLPVWLAPLAHLPNRSIMLTLRKETR